MSSSFYPSSIISQQLFLHCYSFSLSFFFPSSLLHLSLLVFLFLFLTFHPLHFLPSFFRSSFLSSFPFSSFLSPTSFVLSQNFPTQDLAPPTPPSRFCPAPKSPRFSCTRASDVRRHLGDSIFSRALSPLFRRRDFFVGFNGFCAKSRRATFHGFPGFHGAIPAIIPARRCPFISGHTRPYHCGRKTGRFVHLSTSAVVRMSKAEHVSGASCAAQANE